MNNLQKYISTFFVLCASGFFGTQVFAQTTTFTYQGRFTDSTAAQPTTGNYEMEFKAFDAAGGGNQFATTVNLPSVRVINGVFTVSLDYGAQTFRGADVFLEISVRPTGSANPFAVLSPRQQFTSAPYAIQSFNSINALNAGDSTNLGGLAANLYLLKNGDGSALTNVNAATLGGFPANNFVQTSDSRLTDARTPASGSSFYIQNSNSLQSTSNFNISGNGTIGGTLSGNLVNAATQFNINNLRVLTTDVNDNLFAGKISGAVNTTGNSNSFFGRSAGQSNMNGFNNSFFGFNSGLKNVGGANNSFFGLSSGFNNLSDNNSFFGFSAGQANVNGTNNAFFGSFAGFSNLASKNSFFGFAAGQLNTNGNSNSFFGQNSGGANDLGNSNSFFGLDSGKLNQGGSQNTFLGAQSGDANVTGASNTLIGYNAGGNVSNMVGTTSIGSDSSPKGDLITLLGYQANSALGVTNSTAIGANATVTTSNTVVIGTNSMTTEFPGMVKLLNLGAAGSTSLCRNASNQISTCTAGNLAEGGNERITALQLQNNKMIEQIKAQQTEIEGLKTIVCATNPTAAVCQK